MLCYINPLPVRKPSSRIDDKYNSLSWSKHSVDSSDHLQPNFVVIQLEAPLRYG